MVTAQLPIGDEEWQELVQEVASWGDRAESTSVELKGRDLNPSTKEGAAKVARFVLGAANRLPPEDGAGLEGHAVMLIGIESDGHVSGAVPVETHEVSRLVRKYVGEGPRWSLKWIRVTPEVEVLAVVVRPSKAGDPPHLARADGVGIASGDIYVRRAGETSKATATEVDALLQRARSAAVELPRIEVAFVGHIGSFVLREQDFLIPIDGTARNLQAAAGESDKAAANDKGVTLGSSLRDVLQAAALQDPEPRTVEEYLAQVDEWRDECIALFDATVEGLIPYAGQAGYFRIANLSTRYLNDLEVRVHLPGAVFGFEHEDQPVRRSDFMPPAPRKWGPMPRMDWGRITTPIPGPLTPPGQYFPSSQGGPSATLNNSGSVDVTLKLPDLRPSASIDVDDYAWVLAWRGPERPKSVTGTWTATASGLDAVLQGKVEVPCGPDVDMADLWTGRAYARGES